MSKCDNVKKCMCNTRKKVIKFFNSDWDVKDKSMVVSIAVMAGVIIGFLISPIKGGIFSSNKIGSDNTAIDVVDDEADEIAL